MGLFKKLGILFSGTATEKPVYRFTARCNRCGELLQGRVDLYNDPSLDDDGKGYHCRKVLIGEGANHCFNQVEVELVFDEKHHLKERSITGGSFQDR